MIWPEGQRLLTPSPSPPALNGAASSPSVFAIGNLVSE